MKRLNEATNSYIVSTARHINRHFVPISKHNIDSLLGRRDEFDMDLCLSSLFSHQFYLPENRKSSLQHTFFNKKGEVETLPGPYSLLPIPDENNLYIASPVNQESIGWNVFETIPSTEYLTSSYSWDNLLLLQHAQTKFKNYTKEFGADNLSEKINKSLDATTQDNLMYEIAFFNTFFLKDEYVIPNDILNNPGRVKHEIVTHDQFVKILTDQSILKTLIDDQNYHYLAYKQLALPKSKGFEDSCSGASKQDIDAIRSGKIKSSCKNINVIFCDSFDINSLIQMGLIDKYKNIKALLDCSINYKRFTSIGAWTYPCLYSIYSGIPPYWSFSLFPARVDPSCRLMPLGIKKMNEIKKTSSWHQAFYNYRNYKFNHKESYLTRKLKFNGVGQFALKQSSNHSWMFGLQHSVDYCIDNYSNNSFSQVFKDISQYIKSIGKRTNVLYIDIDILHQNIKPVIPPEIKTTAVTDPLSWMRKNITKDERLLGIVSNAENELKKYLEKVSLIDYNIGIIMENLSENDSIILYSDNGSDVLSSGASMDKYNQELSAERSILTYPKIMNPTLLVSDSSLRTNANLTNDSEELVSTIDLHDIILKISGVDVTRSGYDAHLPILPSSLGGSHTREKCYTFSVTKPRASIDSSSILQNFELLIRDQNDNVDYRVSKPVLSDSAPDSFSHPNVVLDLLFS